MRRLRRRMTAVLTALLLLTLLIPWGLAEPAPGPHQTTVLFTHDLHSHFLPLERADGGESGGYARLASALKEERAAQASFILAGVSATRTSMAPASTTSSAACSTRASMASWVLASKVTSR